MTPGQYTLTIYCGDTYHWQFRLWSDTGRTVPVDLTGVTVKAEIRDKPAGTMRGELVCAITAPNIINAGIEAAATATLKSGVWDLQLTWLSGEVATVLAGPVKCTQDVTDSAVVAARKLQLVKSR